MARDLGKAGDYQRVAEDKEYPWPCDSEPNRMVKVFSDDVLHRTSKGVFTMITGLCKLNILIPEEDIVDVVGDKRHLILCGL